MALPPDLAGRLLDRINAAGRQQLTDSWTRTMEDPNFNRNFEEALRIFAPRRGETVEQARYSLTRTLQRMSEQGQGNQAGSPMPQRGPPGLEYGRPQQGMMQQDRYPSGPRGYDQMERPMGGMGRFEEAGPLRDRFPPQQQLEYGLPSREPFGMPPSRGPRGYPPISGLEDRPFGYGQAARERFGAPPWAHPSSPRQHRFPPSTQRQLHDFPECDCM